MTKQKSIPKPITDTNNGLLQEDEFEQFINRKKVETSALRKIFNAMQKNNSGNTVSKKSLEP